MSFHLNYTTFKVVDQETGKDDLLYFPLLSCKFISPHGTSPEVRGLLDSGSDGIILPLALAEHLKLMLHDADSIQVAGGKSVPRWTAKVSVILGRAGRCCPPIKDVTVSIPKEGNPPVLLGRSPVFELYKITFIEAEKRFIMDPYTPKD